jgi:hypothetical protein
LKAFFFYKHPVAMRPKKSVHNRGLGQEVLRVSLHNKKEANALPFNTLPYLTMKTVTVFAFLVTSISLGQAYSFSLPAFSPKSDSIPGRQTTSFSDQLRLVSVDRQPDANRWQMITIQPGKNQSDNEPVQGEVSLPIGFIENTLTVRSGDDVLQADTDYRYIPLTHRLRILNRRVLKSAEPIEITYQMLRLQHKL